MTKEQLQAIWNVEESKRYMSQRIGRYAIKNVRERLTLKYQDDFDLKIKSEQRKGTEVTLIISFREGEGRYSRDYSGIFINSFYTKQEVRFYRLFE